MLDPVDVMADPATSAWLRRTLQSALERDPVDAANDAEVLATLLDARARDALARASGSASAGSLAARGSIGSTAGLAPVRAFEAADIEAFQLLERDPKRP